ncbi:MAG TPA: hypothetical protein VLP43_08900, partial [Solirubrobacteraceae bacterium]|nr:hypothetical protein [Solirubrobacteraceae bacterium]
MRRRSSARRHLRIPLLAVVLLLTAAACGASAALVDLLSTPNDLLTTVFHQVTGGVNIAAAPVQQNPEPPLTAVPPPACGAGSHPDPAPPDGRVPASVMPDAERAGFTCNLSLVAHQGHSGGFKVWRYFDPAGHECAYYDTTLLFPLNALRLDGTSQGVAVIDMSNPAHPVQTETLTSLPMLSPHESLNLDPQRGLLAAVLGNPATYPGRVAIYDVRHDCRHPVLDAEGQYARWGHESGMSPNGTFWATGTGTPALAAIDTTDPHHPKTVWDGNVYVHGLNISADGNRAYLADATEKKLIILDTSQVQQHKAGPQVREISALTWQGVSIPQNAIPFTSHGHPYLLEFDEYATGTYQGASNVPGGVRIIDIADENHPRVVSDIRLQIHQPAAHAAASGDPGALSPVQGYAAHYCNIPTHADPAIVACSMINSGLRVFNIQNLLHPREIAYYVSPPTPRAENGFMASDFAMSRPEFSPERRQIWYTDGTSGLYVLQLSPTAWPAAARPHLLLTTTTRHSCT